MQFSSSIYIQKLVFYSKIGTSCEYIDSIQNRGIKKEDRSPPAKSIYILYALPLLYILNHANATHHLPLHDIVYAYVTSGILYILCVEILPYIILQLNHEKIVLHVCTYITKKSNRISSESMLSLYFHFSTVLSLALCHKLNNPHDRETKNHKYQAYQSSFYSVFTSFDHTLVSSSQDDHQSWSHQCKSHDSPDKKSTRQKKILSKYFKSIIFRSRVLSDIYSLIYIKFTRTIGNTLLVYGYSSFIESLCIYFHEYGTLDVIKKSKQNRYWDSDM